MKLLIASVALAAIAAGGTQAAPTFVNGGFEAGASTGWDLMTAANTPGWTINYGTGSSFPRLNLNIASGGPYGANNEGRQFATIGGTEDGGTSSLAQSVSGFTAGKTYTLTWLQSSEYTSSDVLNVSFLAGSATASGNFTSNPFPGGSQFWQGWQTESMNFVPNATSVTFSFHSFGSNYEVGVDNFLISGAGVPEPAAWALMLLGFGGLGVALRERRKAAIA